MAQIFEPANSCAPVELCGVDICPRSLTNCGNGCFEIFACKSAQFPIELGCNKFTGEDLLTGEVTNIEIKIWHTSETGRVIDKVYTLVDDGGLFVMPSQFEYTFSIPGVDTADLQDGTSCMEIHVETADGEWQIYDIKLCVEVEMLAPPVLCVTGPSGAQSTYQIIGAEVTMCFHESDIVHAQKNWDRFEIDWGDGNIEVLDVSAFTELDSTNACVTHTYAETGNYSISIDAYSDFDASNPCDVELHDCGNTNVCIQVPVVAIP